MSSILHRSSYILTGLIIGAGFLMLISQVMAFTEPTMAPPLDNAAPPLNTSPTPQIKQGPLSAAGNIVNTAPLGGWLGLTGDLPGYTLNQYPTLKTNGNWIYLSTLGEYTGYLGRSTGTNSGIYMKAFYDFDNSAYFLNPNETSNLNYVTNATRARWGLPGRMDVGTGWTDRTAAHGDPSYWTGAQGWGNYNMNTEVPNFGSTFFDIWGTGVTGSPFGAAYNHFQGLQAYHYFNSPVGYGSQLVFDSAGYGVTRGSGMYLRSIWGNQNWTPWVGVCMQNGVNCPAQVGDNLGNHIATQYLTMGPQWINFNGGGIYSSGFGNHFWPTSASYWTMRSDNGLDVYNNAAVRQGLLYHNNAGSFGLLSSDGNWKVQVYNGGVSLYGEIATTGNFYASGDIYSSAAGANMRQMCSTLNLTLQANCPGSAWVISGTNVWTNSSVGILTSSPIAPLSVNGAIANVSSIGYGPVTLESWGLYNNGTYGGGNIYIEPKPGNSFYVVPGDWSQNLNSIFYGNVGIGTDNPYNKLHVIGNIGATGWIGAGCEASCDGVPAGYGIIYGDGRINLAGIASINLNGAVLKGISGPYLSAENDLTQLSGKFMYPGFKDIATNNQTSFYLAADSANSGIYTNGTFTAGGAIKTSADVAGARFADANDNNYFVDPNGVSRVNVIRPTKIEDPDDTTYQLDPNGVSRINELQVDRITPAINFVLGQGSDQTTWYCVDYDLNSICGDQDGCKIKMVSQHEIDGSDQVMTNGETHIYMEGEFSYNRLPGRYGYTRGEGESGWISGYAGAYNVTAVPIGWAIMMTYRYNQCGGDSSLLPAGIFRFTTHPDITTRFMIYD